jgi:hypothetical protein
MFLAVLLVPVVVLAQTATSTTAAPGDLINTTLEAFKSGSWGVGVGGILMLLMAIGRGIGILKWIPAKAVPWVTLGLASLGAIGTGLIAGSDWLTILQAAFTSGLTAIGGWETFGKLVRDQVRKKKDEGA